MSEDRAADLLELAEKLRHVPATYGVDGGDVDDLRAVAKELQAKTLVVDACVAWCEDTGTCHFCGFHDGGLEVRPDEPHDEECPVREYLESQGGAGR